MLHTYILGALVSCTVTCHPNSEFICFERLPNARIYNYREPCWECTLIK